MKKSKKTMRVVLLLLCLVPLARAELFPTMSFDEINSSGMQVGDKLFSNFSIVNYLDGTLAVAPGADQIQVTGVFIGGNYGIRFNAPWLAGSGSIVNSTIAFQVQVVPESGLYIAGNMFALTASNVGSDGGFISAVETVWDAEPGSMGANRLSSLGLYDSADPLNRKLSDQRDFLVDGEPASLKQIWVKKDITLLGGGAGQFAPTHLSEFTQTFVQVPEPASVGMLGSGVIVALLRRSRIRRRNRFVPRDRCFAPIDSMILEAGAEEYSNPCGTPYFYEGREPKAYLPNF